MNRPERLAQAHRLASRMSAIEPFHVVALVTRAKALEAQGRSIVNMVIGEPDFPTPEPVIRAGIAALQAGQVRYTPSLGIPALREALSGWYRTRYGVDVPAARIAVTSGSSGALLLAMGVLLSPGDQVLTADPAYPANRHFVRAMEGESVGIPVDASTGYQLTAELVDRHWTDRTVGVMVASPSNPTGTLIAFDELERIHEVVRRRGGVSDRRRDLPRPDLRLHRAQRPGAGRRSVRHQQLLQVFLHDRLARRLDGRAGGLHGRHREARAEPVHLEPGGVDAGGARRVPARRCSTSWSATAQRSRPSATTCCPSCASWGSTSRWFRRAPSTSTRTAAGSPATAIGFCLDLLETAGVAVAPGIDFGDNQAAAHVRFSYPKPIPVLAEGVRRIREYLAK